jgi:hypothetical protein
LKLKVEIVQFRPVGLADNPTITNASISFGLGSTVELTPLLPKNIIRRYRFFLP